MAIAAARASGGQKGQRSNQLLKEIKSVVEDVMERVDSVEGYKRSLLDPGPRGAYQLDIKAKKSSVPKENGGQFEKYKHKPAPSPSAGRYKPRY